MKQGWRMIQNFSALEGLQNAYDLEYRVEPADAGCWLTLRRTGLRDFSESLLVPLAFEEGQELMRFLYENAVQPESWRALVEEHCPWIRGEKGGPAGER